MLQSKLTLTLLFSAFFLLQSFGQENDSRIDVSHYLVTTYGAESAEAMVLRLNDFELSSSKKVFLDKEYEERKSYWLERMASTNDEALKKLIENRLNLFVPFSAVAEQIIGKP
ncbi:MAG: hypothetical protein ACK5FX_04750 [Flavobacteriia bacterium]|jgi:hypothetical protein